MIELRHVSKSYGPIRALVGVSLVLPEAAVTVVRGANGSGKSTLLALLATLTRPTSGSIRYGALGRTRLDVRRHLGWLGHDALCYPDLTGRENIALAARLHGRDGVASAADAVERFHLAGFADRPMRTYSRGQRQRVALARALIHMPRLLLLDEPTTGLDGASVERLVDAVRAHAEGGATVVVVTHDATFGADLRANEVVLEKGRLVEGAGH